MCFFVYRASMCMCVCGGGCSAVCSSVRATPSLSTSDSELKHVCVCVWLGVRAAAPTPMQTFRSSVGLHLAQTRLQKTFEKHCF